jgi:hypothetical protein
MQKIPRAYLLIIRARVAESRQPAPAESEQSKEKTDE